MTQDDTATTEVPKSRRAQAKAERRLALIEATIDSIAEYGLSGTTIARVTEIAGTSIGLANFYFENKELLFEAVLQLLAEREREVWQKLVVHAGESAADRLIAMIDARFDPQVCNARTMAVWFAFWGDASARLIYRRVVEQTDDDRLAITVPLIASLSADAGDPTRDAYQTALGMEAFFDGLWLNLLLYPDDFRRIDCRNHAVAHLAAHFPDQFDTVPSAATGAGQSACTKDMTHGP